MTSVPMSDEAKLEMGKATSGLRIKQQETVSILTK